MGTLTPGETARRLKSRDGLAWRAGPFVVSLRADVPAFPEQFHLLYGEHRLAEEIGKTNDFRLELARPWGLRRWWRPKVFFEMDGPTRMAPFPLDHALPLFEWGFNYAIATRANQYLLLHAAVVAQGERALLLPGLPGSGKSTLCAALVLRGWRLLSDEFGLLRPGSGELAPLPRSIALKNASIAVIRAFDPAAVLGPEFPKTRKGTVAHLRPPPESVQDQERVARPVWVVSPRFEAGAAARLVPLPRDHGFLRLAHNAFNYELQGERGFRAVTRMTRECRFFDLTFGDPGEAVALLDEMAAS
ncbi:MAG: HprK-related kinase A [Magnetococcales bacterium]|nr:HprK-related kinase A [Magnetococcales bacterium]